MKEKRGSTYKAFSQAFSLSTSLAACVAVGYFGGNYLDRLFHTGPWLTIVFFIFGVGAGLKMMYEALVDKEEDKKEGKKDGS